MIGSQFFVYMHPETGEVILRPGQPIRERSILERHIADVLRIRTNTIAGRPNIGNLALEFIHRGRALPPSIMRDYILRTLRSFIPGVRFEVTVDSEIDKDGFHRFAVGYAA